MCLFWFFPLQLQAETRNKVFAEKLETLLHRAYHLQEDFGSSIPTDSVLADFGKSHFVAFIGIISEPRKSDCDVKI